MNRRAIILATVAGVATIVVTASISGGSTMHLPLPRSATDVKLPSTAQVGKTGAVPATPTTTTTASGNQPTYTIPTPTPLTGCTVSISNPHPAKSQTAETATIQTTPGAQVLLVANYSSTRSSHSAIVGSSGVTSISLPINHAQVGITVLVTVVASLRGVRLTCQTSFTPIP